ncbi:MAG: RnfABCDGE type electron transport complex subunit G [Deferrisomatales bacterium]|nr:RnfABCDGE type electron transport complex subunit G [Deferrisomatales bacterium]
MKDIVRMVLTLVVISAVSAVGLAWVQELTAERIAEAVRQDTLKAIAAVLPPYDNAPDREAVTLSAQLYYPGRKGDALVGLALKVDSPKGYGGDLKALVGINPAGEVTGVRILEHKETPGLGAKITEAGYLRQFLGKSLGNAQWKVKKNGGDFDQITGATITPNALLEAMHGGLEAYRKDQESVLEEVRRSGVPGGRDAGPHGGEEKR